MNDLKELLINGIDLLNQPYVKEAIKNFCSSFTFAFGLVQLGILLSHRKTAIPAVPLKGMERAAQIAQTCTSLSLILSAACSRPCVYFLSTLTDCCFLSDLMENYFGPNTLFDLNPWHPRHIVSLVALALALPSPTLSFIQFFRPMTIEPLETLKNTGWMALFNTLTCRPVLHTGNQLGKLFFLRI